VLCGNRRACVMYCAMARTGHALQWTGDSMAAVSWSLPADIIEKLQSIAHWATLLSNA